MLQQKAMNGMYSGCSNHMTRDGKAFLSINNSITTKVKMWNGALVDAKGKGTISINMKGCGKQIHDVLYVSYLEENFLSIGQLMENGLFCLEIIIARLMIKLSQIKSLLK